MEELDKRYKKSKKVVGRVIADEVIIVPITAETGANNSIYSLNPAGAEIWKMLDGVKTVREIIKQIENAQPVAFDRVKKDVLEWLGELKMIKAVEES